MKKSLFLTFCFSFIPGAGQMYQNYMKRGLSLMCIAGVALIMAAMLQTVIFVIPFLIIMAYSFFDTYNIRNSMGKEDQVKDEYILKNLDINTIKKNRILGIGIILIGVYILITNILPGIFGDIGILEDFVRIIRNYLPSFIVAAITIGIGIKMISSKDNK